MCDRVLCCDFNKFVDRATRTRLGGYSMNFTVMGSSVKLTGLYDDSIITVNGRSKLAVFC